MNALLRLFHRHVLSRTWLTFAVMCTCFGLFGAGTLNIFSMFASNWDMITAQGIMALRQGTFLQLLELLGTLTLAMFFYALFKTCEHALVHRLLHPEEPSKDPS